jgi:DNA-binding CsgD family transcriptional regulator/tetratricopeptide (TPR) repeat protein
VVPSGATGVETFEIPAWPLVGREEELGYLRAARSRHTPASVVVSGLPGVGKSRLMQATLEEARADGWGVLLLSASAGLKNLPFAAFRSGVAPLQTTLKTYGQRADLSELAAVLEETIAGYRTPIGALLAIDDGHCLDDASAGFAHHLAATGSAVVLVTLRSGAERSDALTALWKDGLAERVELQGLSRLETRELADTFLGGPVDEATLERLWQLTDGNPLYVREVLLAASEAGALQWGGDFWRWRGAFTTGARLRELVAERLGRLEPSELTTVELLAVAGVLSFGVIASLTGAASIERLESRALVSVERNGRRTDVRLAHPLYAEVVNSGLPMLRARSIRRILTDALQRTGARRAPDQVSLATWSLDAGLEVDPVTLTTAAEVVLWHPGQEISDRLTEILAGVVPKGRPQDRAAAPADPLLAVRLAEAAYQASPSVETGIALAVTLCWAGDTAASTRLLTELQSTDRSGRDRVRLAAAVSDVGFWGEHRREEAIALLESSLESAVPGVEDDLRAELAGKLAGFEVNADRPSAALAHAEQAARLSGDALAVSFTAPAAAASLSHLGRCAESLFLIDEALPVAIERGRSSMEVPQLLFTRVGTLGRDGRLDEALELASTCHEVALSIESLDGTALFGIAAGETLLRQGRPASAARLFREAVGLLEERDVFGYLRWAFAGLARSAAMLGDSDGAAMALEGARRSALGTRYFDAWLFDAEAAVHSLAGRELEALQTAEQGAKWARRAELPVEEAMLLHTAIRVRAGTGVPIVEQAAARLRELSAVTDSTLVSVLARHAVALANSDASELVAVAHAFADCPARLHAAEAAAEAAEIYGRRHLGRSARSAERRAHAYLAECEGALSPIFEWLRAPAGLTKRELQVATLAAAGHSSNEIAARLDVSARTVDSHLYRTYAKLGITGRPGLAEALGRPSHSRPRPDPG